MRNSRKVTPVDKTTKTPTNNQLCVGLDVRWPMPRLSITPEHVQTYPEDPVTAILEFPEVVCPPMSANAPSAIPEFWLELRYCGHSLLQCDNHTTYAQQVSTTTVISVSSSSSFVVQRHTQDLFLNRTQEDVLIV